MLRIPLPLLTFAVYPAETHTRTHARTHTHTHIHTHTLCEPDSVLRLLSAKPSSGAEEGSKNVAVNTDRYVNLKNETRFRN